MTIAYSESVQRVESPQIKAIKGYLISSEDFLPKEVKELRNRTTLPAPEYIPPPETQDPTPPPVKIQKEINKEAKPKVELAKPKPDEKKDKEKELKKKALEDIKKKLSQPKALPIIAPRIPNRPTPRPENFPLPQGWKESKKATAEIPLPAGSASGQDGADAENEKSRALARYSEMVTNKIISNFNPPYRAAFKENVSNWEIVADIDLDKNGNLKNSNMTKVSGYEVNDVSFSNAIQISSPFPIVPEILLDKGELSFEVHAPKDLLAKYFKED
jgi:outer membrane biosynthesis protein TonB